MESLSLEALVREAAASLGMLDDSGKLKNIDSLGAIDLVVEIENAPNVDIPTEALKHGGIREHRDHRGGASRNQLAVRLIRAKKGPLPWPR